ncbi:MAG TPA: GNAT family N-acetyltransferase [Acidimicrobiales bacterium]|nr:GNAT family N-acetyltransferase [Acidimicrobiales bacterium]
MRPARDSDSDGLIALVGSCFSEFDGCVLDTETEMVHLLRVASHFAAVEGSAWVVEANRSVVGSVAFRPATEARGLELQMLYVLSPWRHRGLGTRLVALVESEAWRRGCLYVDLWSDTRFTDAHRLYRSLGYSQLPGVRELDDLSATREYHFTKTLPT